MLRRITFALVLAAAFSQAAVTRVEITERTNLPVANYERLTGKVYFAVDPKLPANQIIRDIALAPRDAKGMVEFSADLYVLRPRDPAKRNGTALLEISNRGGRGLLGMFDLNNGRDLSNPKDYGDPLLLDDGYTLVWVGWEFDVPNRPGAMRLYAPVIKGLTGPVRAQIVVNKRVTTANIGDRNQVPYPIADAASAKLYVRDHVASARSVIPRDQWQFSADNMHVEYPAGFDPGRVYDLVYTAKDPAVVGLGPAAVRDYISYIKHDGEVKRAIGFGTSQSGRFLRNFIYDGFNADEQGRMVFDGLWPHVAGAGRGNFNYRFAQPSRDGMPLLNLFYAVDVFPFTDEPETENGVTEGLLDRAKNAGVVPKIFYTNSSFGYWGREAAMIHTTLDAKKDVAPPANTRIYLFAGTQHVPAARTVRTVTQNAPNPANYRFAMRALLVAMNNWITNGTPPPDSQIPRISKDNLVAMSAFHFPKIPGVAVPSQPTVAYHLDWGPDFRTKGIISIEPPKLGAPYALRIPQVNSDGNETSGIRLPEIAVPLATYTGWNLRDPKVGSPDVIYDMVGSMIPFARTKAEREKSGDPRPSIQERYRSREQYLGKIDQAAQALVRTHLVLARDAAKIHDEAAARWDSLAKTN